MPYSTTRGRGEAVRVIMTALDRLTASGAAPAQIADLADAVDALRVKSYNVAVELGLASLRPKSSTDAQRPQGMARSLAELASEMKTLSKQD